MPIWSVHDCHTYLPSGLWAKVAVENGTYGICVDRSDSLTANEEVDGLHGKVLVSKRRWAAAKDISQGDTLYLGDTVAKKVYRGLVTAPPVGPFCPLDSLEQSFFCMTGLKSDEKLATTVELVYKVHWEEVGDLTPEWYDRLGTGRRVTVSPFTP
jgi:hypothetical protein